MQKDPDSGDDHTCPNGNEAHEVCNKGVSMLFMSTNFVRVLVALSGGAECVLEVEELVDLEEDGTAQHEAGVDEEVHVHVLEVLKY